MKDYIEERAVEIAYYIIEHKATVRQTAKQFGVSKSTIRIDVIKQNGLYGGLNNRKMKGLQELSRFCKPLIILTMIDNIFQLTVCGKRHLTYCKYFYCEISTYFP
jgi:putative DeoR family transcriptional regulator (stage III sporulation protein D)